ncbi:putative ABC transport system ATP-binding protein [Enterococcus sp. PF1-24]|uniref:ABC transporter ATP-binding protein n=1 Tax=unclassified Enterococcus TaxID=2608891 RepID=UPI00247695DB|nr:MULTISPECIES: ABC transporter ATP-binding protein [unclassified Enterococcus]MDH6363943.1 putative ABC transport system ATP-binding protein [Enterococcus sp. PFB1-1]MDH6401044.1 putative ABC transport system ATP-binding protein [Enterococcus sp. PF1-24]
MELLQVNNLKKIYRTRLSSHQVEALKDVNFTVEDGEYIAIMGESGSGKSTLLNILATLDKATSGEVLLQQQNLSSIPEGQLAKFRREHLGFVFQDFNLLDTFNVKDNIFLPLVLSRVPLKEMNQRLTPLAEALGIADLLDKFPYEISGGQKQRVAVARALITQPALVLADEPTGALDSRSADALLELFSEINQAGQTILMVTHSAVAASHAKRVLFIRDGQIFHQLYRGERNQSEFMAEISDTLTVLLTKGV